MDVYLLYLGAGLIPSPYANQGAMVAALQQSQLATLATNATSKHCRFLFSIDIVAWKHRCIFIPVASFLLTAGVLAEASLRNTAVATQLAAMVGVQNSVLHVSNLNEEVKISY